MGDWGWGIEPEVGGMRAEMKIIEITENEAKAMKGMLCDGRLIEYLASFVDESPSHCTIFTEDYFDFASRKNIIHTNLKGKD